MYSKMPTDFFFSGSGWPTKTKNIHLPQNDYENHLLKFRIFFTVGSATLSDISWLRIGSIERSFLIGQDVNTANRIYSNSLTKQSV